MATSNTLALINCKNVIILRTVLLFKLEYKVAS